MGVEPAELDALAVFLFAGKGSNRRSFILTCLSH